MNTSSKIYVAGHRGLVGSAIVKELQQKGYANILTRTREELDLLDAQKVHHFFETEKPEYVFLSKSDLVTPAELKKKLAALKKLNRKTIAVSIHDEASIKEVQKILNKIQSDK